MYTFLNRKWFFDKVYNEYITQHVLSFGYQTTYKLIDRGLFEFIGTIRNNTYCLGKWTFIYKSSNRICLPLYFCNVSRINSFIALVGLWSTISAVFDIRLVILICY